MKIRAFSFLALVAASASAEPVWVDFAKPGPDDPPSEQMVLEAWGATNGLVRFQVSTNLLAEDGWADVSLPIPSPDGVATWVLPQDEEESSRLGFYRAQSDAFINIAFDDGSDFHLILDQPAPLYAVLLELQEASGQNIYPLDDAYDPFILVSPGAYAAPNIEELTEQFGFSAWVTPGDTDDTNYLARVRPPASGPLSRIPFPPGLMGTNVMEDGFAGVVGLPDPLPGDEDPQIDPDADMGFDVDIDPLPPGTFPEEDPAVAAAGRHLRMLVRFDPDEGFELVELLQRPGDNNLDPLPGGWPEGDYAMVARSADIDHPDGLIYSIRQVRNPLFDHPYDFPAEDAEWPTSSLTQASLFWMPVPIREEDVDLSSVTVTLYRITQDLEEGPVDAAAYHRQSSKFQPVTEFAGHDLDPVLPPKGLPDLQFPPDQLWPGSSAAPQVTPIFRGGSKAQKYNIVIIGDGFNNTQASQDLFNDWVDDAMVNEVMSRDVHVDIRNAWNVFRVNTFSIDEGVTQLDTNGNISVSRQTALDYRYSGEWAQFWMEAGPDSYERIANILKHSVPEADLIMVIVNEIGPGGRANPPYIATSLGDPPGANWGTVAHELGHAFGSLGDEYFCQLGATNPVCPPYNGPEVAAINQTIRYKWEDIKWRQWIPPWRPLPTLLRKWIADEVEDVGIFPGVTRGKHRYWGNIYRPAWNSRMRSNARDLHPVGYAAMIHRARPYQSHDFRRHVVTGGVGWLRDQRRVRLIFTTYDSTGVSLVDPITKKTMRETREVIYQATSHLIDSVPVQSTNDVWWLFDNTDRWALADFNGDDRSDFFLSNPTRWTQPVLGLLRGTGNISPGIKTEALYGPTLPGWGAMKVGDVIRSGDFTGDGNDGLFIYNGLDWDQPYFGMLSVTQAVDGFKLQFVRRYDGQVPFNQLGANEQIHVADFDGDGRDDVLFVNPEDWNKVNWMLYRSTGDGLQLIEQHYGVITNNATTGPNWVLRKNDQLFIGDFSGNGEPDIALFNGTDWAEPVLGIFTREAAGFTLQQRYAGSVFNFDLSPHDQLTVADVDGDGRDDIVLMNTVDWEEGVLAMLRTQPNLALFPTWQTDRVGTWKLLPGDRVERLPFSGSGMSDLLIYSQNRIALLRSEATRYTLESYFPGYIKIHRYHVRGFY